MAKLAPRRKSERLSGVEMRAEMHGFQMRGARLQTPLQRRRRAHAVFVRRQREREVHEGVEAGRSVAALRAAHLR
eukprot:2416829-Pleurochrysis_carterae.AAC.1